MNRTCLKCNAILPADTLAGQCIRCLLELGLIDLGLNDSTGSLAEQIGDWIGSYRLVETLGEGGYGKVYLAEQEFPVRRRVALKVIKVGMDTAQVIARFEAERQALALMDHPNIAKVLDAGATDSGRPFFVMELVSGERITDYCNNRQLPIKDRLNLFTKVCEAVQHAHHKGIIHRDLKPSNVMVADTENGPVPKVIDFGIAKATGGERLTDRTLFTAFEQFIGTPAYMSPEQAAMSGTDIDTRSDVYSLGVLLYELLTGRMPFEPKRLFDAGLDEIRRIIREEEPPRPSTRISTLNVDEKTTVAAQHQTEPPRLVHQVRGDLDWIVMKSLEKDRVRRYETANDFAQDIQRHLNNEPVVARPPSNAYRFKKMVRRNKLAFGAIAAVASSLIVGLAVSTWMFFNERAARQRADIAEQEQSRLREVAELRAYSSDMNLAAQSVQTLGSLNGLANLLDTWRNHTPDLRGWEWYYLNGFLHHDQLTVHGDEKGMRAFSWSPDGGRFATGGDNGTISIWDAKDGRKLAAFDGGAPIVCVAWHPQKEQLVSSTTYGVLAIWDVATATAIKSWRPHTGQIPSVAWSSDGSKLAVAAYIEKVITIWDVETGAELARIPDAGIVQIIAWNPDNTVIASSGDPLKTQLWDPSTGKRLRVIDSKSFGGLDWSPDGRFLATGGYDCQIRIWEVENVKLLAEYFGHGGAIQKMKWSPDGKQMITTGRDDGAIKVWEPFTGKLLQHYRGHRQGIHALEWHPDGKKIGSSSLDGTAKIWDADAGDASQIRLANDASICSATWSHDGRQLAIGDKQGQVQIWDGTSKFPKKFFPGRNWSWNVAWHPDGKQIASGTGDGLIEIWDVEAGTKTDSISVSKAAIRTVSWNPQGTMLAGGGSPLRIWDAAGRNLLASVDLLFTPCNMIDWSPDGALIAAAGGKTLCIVDVATRQISQSLRGHRDLARCVAWSADGKFLASGGEDTVGIIWDAKSGSMLRKLSGHGATIQSVAWSPDGQRIATGSWDCTLKIWNANTGQELCSIKTGNTPVMAVAWHPDGDRILAGDLAGALYIHDSSPGLSKNRLPAEKHVFNQPGDEELNQRPSDADTWDSMVQERDKLAEILEQVISLRKTHPDSWELGGKLDRLCSESFDRRKFAQTEAAARELITLRRKLEGEKSASYMHALHWLGLALWMQKSWAEAEPVYRECLSVVELLPDDPMLASGFKFVIRSEFGDVLQEQKNYSEAEPLLLEAFDQLQKSSATNFAWAAKDTAERLMRLYEAKGETNLAAHWRSAAQQFSSAR